jgi:hypothetical protein
MGSVLYEGRLMCVGLALEGEATCCSITMKTAAGPDNKKGLGDGVLNRTPFIPISTKGWTPIRPPVLFHLSLSLIFYLLL